MIYLDDKADTCPDGLQGTPFWEVYSALRQVAATGAWPVDPGAYRAGMAWGWYALHKPEYLTSFREVVQAALVSACAPMIRPTQTDAELVEYLRQWRVYRPTFPQLQSLYLLFGAVVDIQPISDPESQAVLPVDNTRLAFYLRIESVDPERPLSLSDAITIAERATPIGSRPYAYYVQESRITVPVALAPTGVTVWVENDTVASDPPPLPVYGIPMGGVLTSTSDSVIRVPVEQAGGVISVFPLDLIVGMNIDNSTGELIAITFDYSLEDNYWNTRVKNAEDKELLRKFGLWADVTAFLYGSVLNALSYRYEIIEIYTGIGEGVAPFNLSDFYIPDDLGLIALRCTSSYSTPVKSWKLRITPITQES